jgi:twitching motility two-component system response regulator PilH
MALVLVADDSLFQRMVLSRVARAAGADVAEAKDGEECLALARERRPKVVVLDLNMPGLDGFGVLKALRDEGLLGQVVVITADIQKSTEARCFELGAALVLHKPVDEAVLRERIEDLLA